MQNWEELERSFPMDNPEVREWVRELFESLEDAPQVCEELRRETAAMQASMERLEETMIRWRASNVAHPIKLGNNN